MIFTVFACGPLLEAVMYPVRSASFFHKNWIM